MQLIDTHTHVYLEQFDTDRNQTIENAIHAGIKYLMLPNVDSTTIDAMLQTEKNFPKNCLPLMGVHPSSVKTDFENELNIAEKWLTKHKFYGIGETGIDLYWDKTYFEQQIISFRKNIEWAKQYNLPIIIHTRNSFRETIEIMKPLISSTITGIFHCYSGDIEQAHIVTEWGFKIGIGGVITYKNNNLVEIVREIDLKHIVIETDAPFLPPVPKRGLRNESLFLHYIANKIAEIKGISVEKVAEITTQNALEVFKLNS